MTRFFSLPLFLFHVICVVWIDLSFLRNAGLAASRYDILPGLRIPPISYGFRRAGVIRGGRQLFLLFLDDYHDDCRNDHNCRNDYHGNSPTVLAILFGFVL